MANTLDKAKKYTGELDKAIVQDSVTGFLTDNALRTKFIGTDTVLIPEVGFVGLGAYDREEGFPLGSVTVTNKPYQLKMDRGREISIDRMDMDELGIAGLAGEVLREYVRTQSAPEMDAYVLSTLAQTASEKNGEKTFDAEKVYSIFTEMEMAIRSKAGFGKELVCFIDPVAYAAFMSTPEISRSITVSDFKKGGVDLKVKKLNDVSLIPVAADRMKTVFEFDEGETDNAGGFTVGEGAKNINMLMLAKDGASLVNKHETLRTFGPEENQKKDAYLYQYRVHYDVFVENSRLEHIAVATSTI